MLQLQAGQLQQAQGLLQLRGQLQLDAGANREMRCGPDHGLHAEVVAQVHPAHFGVVHDGLRRAVGEHRALADDAGVVANAQGFAHVVVGDQHANAARFQKADDALDLDHGNRVDAGKGLVQQNKARVRGQGAGNFHAPALTA